jgi:hypothetical protein
VIYKSPEALEPDEEINKEQLLLYYTQEMRIKHFRCCYLGFAPRTDPEKILLVGRTINAKKTDSMAVMSIYEIKEGALDNGYPETFNIHALTAGFRAQLVNFSNIDLIGGTQLTLYGVDKDLQSLYGKTPIGFELYLQLRPSIHKH